MNIAEMLSFEFMQNALVAGGALAFVAALLGVCLVLRRNSMIGDGLSHAGFAAFALATVFGFLPLPFALILVAVLSTVVLRLSKNKNGDAAVAVLSAASLAIGTFAISVKQGVNVDINSYLFGSVLAVSRGEAILAVVLVVLVGAVFILCYHRIFALTFDEKFARTVGVKVGLYDVIFAVICSLVIVLGMRLLGALLISALIVFPALTAMRLVGTFRSIVVTSAIISIVTFCVGLFLSYAMSAPVGSTIVIVDLVVFASACAIKKLS